MRYVKNKNTGEVYILYNFVYDWNGNRGVVGIVAPRDNPSSGFKIVDMNDLVPLLNI